MLDWNVNEVDNNDHLTSFAELSCEAGRAETDTGGRRSAVETLNLLTLGTVEMRGADAGTVRSADSSVQTAVGRLRRGQAYKYSLSVVVYYPSFLPALQKAVAVRWNVAPKLSVP